MTQDVKKRMHILDGAPWLRIFPVRTPTLPPATHTNVYLVGEGRLVIIDPASPYADEQAALDAYIDGLAEAGDRIVEIVLTHHHIDHISGAAHLSARLGVGVAAHRETAERVKNGLRVTRLIDENEVLPYGPQGLTAMFTPGHAPGHLCFFDARAGAVVAGDMVASQGTIIVEPADGGDMSAYLESLRRLRALEAKWLCPAHGPPIEDVTGKLDFYIAHRLERERRVEAALTAAPHTIEELVPPAYPDVAPAVYHLAARSLLAHLIKLEREGRARRVGEKWCSQG